MVEILKLIEKCKKRPRISGQTETSKEQAEHVIMVPNPFDDLDEFRRSAFKRVPGVVNLTKPGADTWLRKS